MPIALPWRSFAASCRLPFTNQELARIAHRFHADQAALSALLSDSAENTNTH